MLPFFKHLYGSCPSLDIYQADPPIGTVILSSYYFHSVLYLWCYMASNLRRTVLETEQMARHRMGTWVSYAQHIHSFAGCQA